MREKAVVGFAVTALLLAACTPSSGTPTGGSSVPASASTANSAGSSVPPAKAITFVDTASGANFQQFFREILPSAEQELGIKISYIPGNPAELLQRLKAGQANQDLILAGDYDVASLITGGIPLVNLQVNTKQIPNLSLVAPSDLASLEGVPSQGKGTPFYRFQEGIAYDSAKIPNPPTTWAGFFNRRAEWSGHIGIVRPDAAPPPGRYMIYDFLRGSGVDESLPLNDILKSAAFTKAVADFKAFSQAFHKPAFNAPPDVFAQFAAGTVSIAELPMDFALWSRDQGLLPPTVKATLMHSPMVGASSWLVVPANIPPANQAAAFELINWLISVNTQSRMLIEMHEYPAISAWDKMPASAFKDIPTWDDISPFRKTVGNADLLDWIKQNGSGFLAQ